MIETVEKVDDNHIRVTFTIPVSPIDVPFLLSFKIIPSAYQGKPMEVNRGTASSLAFNRNPIGTGAYKFESWKSNMLLFQKADPSLQIEKITIQRQRDTDIRVKKLIDNKIDLIFDVDPSFFEILQKNQFEYSDYLPYAYYAVAFNTTDSLLSDPYLRRAMALAADKTALLSQAYGVNNGEYINYGPFPHNSHKLYRSFEDVSMFDSNKAEEELRKSQYLRQSITLIYPEEYGETGEKIAYGYKHMMEKIGIEIEVVKAGLDFHSKLKSMEYQIALFYDRDFDRHYNILPVYLSDGARNITGIKDQELDDLLHQWNSTIIMTEKVPIAFTIHQKISDICPYVYLFTPPQRTYHSSRLRSVTIANPNSLLASVDKWGIVLDEE